MRSSACLCLPSDFQDISKHKSVNKTVRLRLQLGCQLFVVDRDVCIETLEGYVANGGVSYDVLIHQDCSENRTCVQRVKRLVMRSSALARLSQTRTQEML